MPPAKWSPRTRLICQRAEIETALAHFVGATQQMPPMHSAIKRDGQKLYEWRAPASKWNAHRAR